MKRVFNRQSSAADWESSIQFIDDNDGLPAWASVPADLLLTMNVIPSSPSSTRDYGNIDASDAAVITAVSTDATGRLTASDNGIINIRVDASDMAALAPDTYEADKRYLVFLKVQFTVIDSTEQGFVGVLPVYKGA